MFQQPKYAINKYDFHSILIYQFFINLLICVPLEVIIFNKYCPFGI